MKVLGVNFFLKHSVYNGVEIAIQTVNIEYKNA